MNGIFNGTFDLTDILDDPHKFGLPTLEEFKKHSTLYQDKFFGRSDDMLASADRGSSILGNSVVKQVYSVFGYRAKTLEEVEKIMKDHGHVSTDFEMVPQFKMETNFKGILVVNFVLKSVLEKLKQNKTRKDALNEKPVQE